RLGCATVRYANAPRAQSLPTNDRVGKPCIFPIDTWKAHQPTLCIHPRQAARPADRARPSTNNRLVTDVSSLRRGELFMRRTKLRKWQGAIAERAGFPRTARRSVPTSLHP